jgi:dolichol kinase
MQTNIMYIETKVTRAREGYSELLRKSLHMAIALVPTLAALNIQLTMVALAGGVLFYSWSEAMRISGYRIPVVTEVTHRASRGKDMEGMVLGPVTLAIGAMLALMLYPDPVSTIAIYALAFGDGFASLVGRMWGSISLPSNRKKTFEGSFACFTAVFLITVRYFDNPFQAVAVALAAALIESLPLGDMDNVVLPFGVGMMTELIML